MWVKNKRTIKLWIEVSGNYFGENVLMTMPHHYFAILNLSHTKMEFKYESHRLYKVYYSIPCCNAKLKKARIEESLMVVVGLLGWSMKRSPGCALRSVVMILGRISRRQCNAIYLPPLNCPTWKWSWGLGEGELWVPKFCATWNEGWRKWQHEMDLSHTRLALPSNSFSHSQRFLSHRGGDEDSGLSKHFMEDRVIGLVPI